MPTGEPTGPRGRLRRRPMGFTYVALLFAVALAGAGLAALGTQWQQQAQREREAELLFRGLQLRDALLAYAAASPDGQPAQPGDLAELLDDRRGGTRRFHLRRLWPDPFTGQPDWQLLRNDAGGITGVSSRAMHAALRRHGLPPGVLVANAAPDAPRVSDWQFNAGSAAPLPTAPAASPTPRTDPP